MSKLLLVTVGGSFQPVLTAIRSIAADRVIFVVSTGTRSQVDGPGSPCEVRRGAEVIERKPNLVVQTGLSNRFNPATDVAMVHDSDNLYEVYSACAAAIRNATLAEPGIEISADYTGATKTMSAGLVLAAMDWNAHLYVTSGERRNIIRVDAGEITSRAPMVRTQVERFLTRNLPRLLAAFDYHFPIGKIPRLLQRAELDPAHKRKLQDVYSLCLGLDAWDRFDHAQAWEYLGGMMNQPGIRDLALFLKRVMSSRAQVDPEFTPPAQTGGHGYEIVEDLLLNAERRAAGERYDDAIGRLYRALELTAQIRLATRWKINTSKVDLKKIPETVRDRYASPPGETHATIEIGLWRAYSLIVELGDTEIAPLFQARDRRLLDALKKRNTSLFAHGFSPVTCEDYRKVSGEFTGFIHDCIAAVAGPKRNAPTQFPTQLLDARAEKC